MSWYYNLYMKLASTKSRFGFTLVELMVVISIIGILSAIVYASFGTSRKIARDDIRKTDLKNLQVAIELYKAQNGQYPASGCSTANNKYAGPGVSSDPYLSCDDYITGLVPDFISVLPKDPNKQGNGFGYYYRSSGTGYKLLAKNSVEIATIKSYSDDFARCPAINSGFCPGALPPTNVYAVYKNADSW